MMFQTAGKVSALLIVYAVTISRISAARMKTMSSRKPRFFLTFMSYENTTKRIKIDRKIAAAIE